MKEQKSELEVPEVSTCVHDVIVTGHKEGLVEEYSPSMSDVTLLSSTRVVTKLALLTFITKAFPLATVHGSMIVMVIPGSHGEGIK